MTKRFDFAAVERFIRTADPVRSIQAIALREQLETADLDALTARLDGSSVLFAEATLRGATAREKLEALMAEVAG